MHADFTRLLADAQRGTLVFQEVIDTIRRHYACSPVAFRTGDGTSRAVDNPAGTNAGSCLLLAFARGLGLDAGTTLTLWAEHYRAVVDEPGGNAHANIRAFMANGWQGVTLAGDPLLLRGPG